MQTNKSKAPDCNECEHLRLYDYVYRYYYCDHDNRTDDMGKLGAEHIPEESPIWCPLRVNE